jgi:uncharacterized protein YjbI with pentapeptide repeats
MEAEQTLRIEHEKQRIEAAHADLSGSTFTDVNLAESTFENVKLSGTNICDVNLSESSIECANLSGLRIHQANLRGASIADSHTESMTIDGIPVAALLAAYRSAHPSGSK